MKPKIVIMGAGLTGLLIAHKLKQSGFNILVIEARDRPGGRILTLRSANETPVEMGATWFGNQHIHLISLLKELQIQSYEQYMKGTAFFEAFSTEPPQPIEIPEDSASYRIEGGTSQIINVLVNRLDADEIKYNEPVTQLNFKNESVTIKTRDSLIEADIVISTLPPALLVNTIHFTPALPNELINIASQTHTWMQDSIKAAIVYTSPFWKMRNLSGTIFSNVGPITEFYDHSDISNTHFALCGFINSGYSQLSKTEREEKIINQLKKIFGKDANEYISYEEVIWQQELYTKSKMQNNVAVYPHQNNGHPVFHDQFYGNKLYIAGTETSAIFPGYMEGAVVSANQTADTVIAVNNHSA